MKMGKTSPFPAILPYRGRRANTLLKDWDGSFVGLGLQNKTQTFLDGSGAVRRVHVVERQAGALRVGSGEYHQVAGDPVAQRHRADGEEAAGRPDSDGHGTGALMQRGKPHKGAN